MKDPEPLLQDHLRKSTLAFIKSLLSYLVGVTDQRLDERDQRTTVRHA